MKKEKKWEKSGKDEKNGKLKLVRGKEVRYNIFIRLVYKGIIALHKGSAI